MLAITLVFSALFAIMSLVVGTLLGWVYREYTWSQQPQNIHPEFFDVNGNIIPDEIISVRFDQSMLEEEEEPED